MARTRLTAIALLAVAVVLAAPAAAGAVTTVYAVGDGDGSAIGNHEYPNLSSGYYPYWRSKRPGWTDTIAQHRAYVTPEGWQVIAYSSEHQAADRSAGRTTERDWVAARVAEHGGTCRIVLAHKGRYVVADTSGGDDGAQGPIWTAIRNKTALNLVGGL